MWFCWVFHTQLLAECRFGWSESLKMLRKFSWDWLYFERLVCSSGSVKFSPSSVRKLRLSLAGLVTLPLLVPSGIHCPGWELPQPQSKTWAKAFSSREEKQETRRGAEFWREPDEISRLNLWTGFYSLSPWHVAHPPEPPALLQQPEEEHPGRLPSLIWIYASGALLTVCFLPLST